MNLGIGAVGISKWDGCISPAYYALYSNSQDINYFYNMFRIPDFQKHLASMGTGIMELRKRIKIVDILNSNVAVPSLDEQKAISEFLDSETSKIDTQIQYYESLINELKSFKQSIISEAVTGKLTA